jgi:hypothetical protein
LLRDIVTQAEPLIGGYNRTVFFMFLGIRLHETLTDFLVTLKFRSPEGCCVLAMDISDYDEAFSLFHVPALQNRIADLRKIGQLMTTPTWHHGDTGLVDIGRRILPGTPKGVLAAEVRRKGDQGQGRW